MEKLLSLFLALSSARGHSFFSEIVIDQHPCKPEVLKVRFRHKAAIGQLYLLSYYL